jgi:hypothetical protein
LENFARSPSFTSLAAPTPAPAITKPAKPYSATLSVPS